MNSLGPIRSSRVTVSGLAHRAYETFATRPALVATDGTITTFRELGELASRVAGALGLAAGDRVVIVAKNRPEFVVVDHALMWGGLVRVPLSFRLHPMEVASVAADCAARVVFVEADAVATTREALASVGAAATVIDITDIASLARHAPVPAVIPEADDLFWLPYTSGTTGTPKGVMHSHRTILACLRNIMAELPPTTPADSVLHVAPLSHLSGWVGLATLLRGAAQLFMADFDAPRALAIIAERRVTIMPAVPTIVRLLTPVAETSKLDWSSLHTILYAGSAIAAENLARAVKAFGDVFIQMYGLTELPMPIASLQKADHRTKPGEAAPQLAAAGRVTPFVEVRLVDANGADVAPGEAGEIIVRADMMMLGYWNRPADTSDFFRADGFAGTGDVGRIEDGHLYIIDRKRDMIVSGGFNIFPSEVERVVASIRGVQEVVVIGVPSKEWGESVMALVVRSPGLEVTEDDIREACRASIAGYKKPREIAFVSELPKNGAGKVMRRELREKYWGDRVRRVDG